MTKKVGTRQEVVAGKALQTKGGLTADDLFVVTSAKGVEKIVSKKASNAIKQRLAQNAAVAADAESSGSDSELAKVNPVDPPEPKTKPAKKKESSRVTPPAEVAAVADVDAATMKSLSELSGKPKAGPKAAAKPKAEKKAAKPKAPRKPKQPKVVAEDEVEDDVDEVEPSDE